MNIIIHKTPTLWMGYVLLLEDKKIYVGISNHLNKRLAYHFMGEGAKWTRIYRPEDTLLIKIIPDCFDISVARKWEDMITLDYMVEHGWENVRGGSWCKIDMPNPPLLLKKHKLDKIK